jgi:DMSO reductase family type II enzyme chaperone
VTAAADDLATAARSVVYQNFAFAFSPPDEVLWETMRGGDLAAGLAAAGEALPYDAPFALDGLAALADGLGPDALIAAYTSNFEVGNCPVPLAERHYAKAEVFRLFEDLFRVYEHFGLEFVGDARRERPDHLVVQLEFLHYLTYLEARCPSRRGALRRAQRDFLRRHPGDWVAKLAAAMEAADVGPYGALASGLRDFLDAEGRYLKAI